MTNPLQNYFRKPEIYMKLPSQGRWYPPGVLELNEAGEVGIMAMTARDEMIVRTPDALLNGQATVDVIKSCVPAISDPWCIPQMDIDTILLGIRIATYGSGMDFTTAPPGIALTQEVKVDLNKLVSMIKIGNYNDTVRLSNGLTLKTKPGDNRAFTSSAMKTYEEQRMLRTIQDSTLSESEKVQKFTKIFTDLSDMSVDVMSSMIIQVQTPDSDPVTDPIHIKEFVFNMDTKIADEIKAHVATNGQIGRIPPIDVESSQEQIKAGAPEKYSTSIAFDNSNFFAYKSSR